MTAKRRVSNDRTRREPLVSVVMIFLNAERFIEEAIESVFAQTYENWELLLVDDGSTDASINIAKCYAEEHPERVCYLEHPGHENRGMSASRNLGMCNARGEYVGFLDSDDVWLPCKLERQVQIFRSQRQATMLYGNTLYWYGWTEDPEDTERDFMPELGIRTNALFEPPTLLTVLYPLGEATAPSSSSLLFKREVMERTGGYEESFTGMYEDQAFLTKAYLKESVFVADECWDLYRQHPESCLSTATEAGRYYQVRLFFLDWLAGYLSDQGVKDREIWRLLREERYFARARICLQKREWQEAAWAALALLRHHPQRFVRSLRILVYRAYRRLTGVSTDPPKAGPVTGK